MAMDRVFIHIISVDMEIKIVRLMAVFTPQVIIGVYKSVGLFSCNADHDTRNELILFFI